MALADFFDKVALGASQILKGFDRNEFENLLTAEKIMILFDDNATSTLEGRASLDLLVRLLARLYPQLSIKSSSSPAYLKGLKKLALAINPKIDLKSIKNPSICIVVGKTTCAYNVPTFYIGSENWITKFSITTPVGSGHSRNPFAAGVAACFGAANIFRKVFSKQLPYSEIDSDFSLSIFDYSFSPNECGPEINEISLDDTVLVGLGAIGNGVVWSLSYLQNMAGKLSIVDGETISLSNLQRYVITEKIHIGSSKVELAEKVLENTGLNVTKVPHSWAEYIQQNQNWEIETIAVCVDNAEDRILVQGALPKYLFNAWTQQENLAVSRHVSFIEDACLCCLYKPTVVKESYSEQIAKSLNMTEQEPLIRNFLANNKAIDQSLLELISQANNIQPDTISSFLGQSLEVFYSEVVCGGTLMKLNGSNGSISDSNSEVPAAFESAMAGIMLAAEIVINKNFPREKMPTTTSFNLIRRISTYIHGYENKTQQCICDDVVYQQAYINKWLNIESQIV